MGMSERIAMLVAMRREDLPLVRSNAQDREKDRDGSASHMLALQLRFIGVADFLLHHEVRSFRARLSEAATLHLRLFERYENDEPVDASYVTMLSYKAVFDALAAGDMVLARSLASHMGGRGELEKKHDHPFDYALGYTLRAFVLRQREEMERWAPRWSTICREASNADFRGYAELFTGILSEDVDSANKALRTLVEGHKKQSKGRGVFKDTEDEVLCVWGTGMANLARSYGLKVEAVPALIPQELLV